MKKLQLKLDDLQVTSFSAQADTRRSVYGLATFTCFCGTGALACGGTEQTRCLCTDAEGCYPSLYCSGAGPGEPNQTCYEGCMTNENGAC